MFVDFDTPFPSAPRGLRWTDLPDDEALLLWSLRRMVIAWPRCHAVHAALHQRFGEDALGVEHLLRCWLTGIARHAARPLQLGDPACALILPDEGVLLYALSQADDEAALAGMCGSGAASLLPLTAALAALTCA
ncbi:hypothetical protein [Glacieibacterium frigidum]|uniref:Uncharacterized protein n=1 Tax=Glacieibacterium frigidum TaxID=2593303 RepID=A0A552UJ60_9SPHN|nr:hypothetical protein [Glacieibacterium frigidum]TRW18279.1 hypothetical protein FMM06_09360 [Glacieibacterium frigidum]